MKEDKDLLFLAKCQNDDLRTLCDILTHNKQGELRFSEQLSNTDAYLNCYPEKMNLMAKEISEEFRKFGSNTVHTLYKKGEADSYETILRRVCKKLKVSVAYNDNVNMMEQQLLTTLCEKTTEKLSDEELRDLADKAGISHKNLNRQQIVFSLMISLRTNRYLFVELMTFIITRIANMIFGRTISMMGMMTFERYVGMLAGPIGWGMLACWTISDIASPAYRVVIPAVIMIAGMRYRHVELSEA